MQAHFQPHCSKVGNSHLRPDLKQLHIESEKQEHPGVERTPLLLQSELLHPEFLNRILQKRASLVTMNRKREHSDDVYTASTLSSLDVSSFAEAFADSFYQNVFREDEAKSQFLK